MKTEAGVQPQVLFISDDLKTCQARLLALHQWNIGGTVKCSVSVMMDKKIDEYYNLLVVDVHTREFDGIAACRDLRDTSVGPVLLLDYTRDERDIVAAYQAGVDDYIVKPISLPLFVCKVRAWLRHTWTGQVTELRYRETKGVQLDPVRRQLVIDGVRVRLTDLELQLLNLLMAHEGQALSGERIVRRVWGYGEGNKAVLKNAIYRLRRKIEPDPYEPRYLQTVRGKGYLFTAEVE